MNLDTVLGPVSIPETQADVYLHSGAQPGGNPQGSYMGRRASEICLYTSVDLCLLSGDGRGDAVAVIKAYETDGPGADDLAIVHFRETGCFDHRYGCAGHEKKE